MHHEEVGRTLLPNRIKKSNEEALVTQVAGSEATTFSKSLLPKLSDRMVN